MRESLLRIEHLKTHFPVRGRCLSSRATDVVKAVDGVSFTVDAGEVLGLVGESGCGKSTVARTIVRLVPPTSGQVFFDGQPMHLMSGATLRRMRPQLQMIFQDPYASLNPRRTVFDTLAEPMWAHRLVTRANLAREVGALMEQVGLARRYLYKYPHEFSGGQRQRIAIARALALRPKLILADEPVSALDVSVQAQILNLLKELREHYGLAMLLISHDLSVVKHMSRRIAVMYLGKIVELGPAKEVFENPLHPYSRALVSAVPVPDPDLEAARRPILLQGDPPSPLQPPAGCPFHPRCPFAIAACAQQMPELAEFLPGRHAACIRLSEITAGATR